MIGGTEKKQSRRKRVCPGLSFFFYKGGALLVPAAEGKQNKSKGDVWGEPAAGPP